MTSQQYVYVMKGLTKTYAGARAVVEDVWLSFYPGAKIGVLGLNGSGKSSLLRIMAGEDKEYQGEAWIADDVKVGFLPQEPSLNTEKNVLENIMEAVADTLELLEKFNEISSRFGEEMSTDEMDILITKQAALQDQIDAADAWDLDRHIKISMDALRCPAGSADVTKLSGGERRRVALCRLLLSKPDMLLLDEPTNHLDAESVSWLEHFLAGYAGTVVAVTHDRYFLDNVAGWILELDRGKAIPFEGNYSAWLEAKDKRLSQEEKEESNRQRSIRQELQWIRQSPRARQAKSKARVSAFEQLVADSSVRAPEKQQITIPAGKRLGDLVIETKKLSKGYDERVLISGLDLKIPPGAIVGVIGPNGAGKTTFCNLVTGHEMPDKGELIVGDSVVLGYVDQNRDSLSEDKNVWEEITGGLDIIELGRKNIQSRAYVAGFNFRGPDQQKKVGNLSGGERNRVHLAKMLKSGANVLLLDEPTNDLDVDTLRALEEALLDFAGCAIVVSHDRWFLDRIATHILAFESNNSTVWFEGNYQSYETDHKQRQDNSNGH
ncbi:MAG: energy-dependent translational throttle protein EttA [Alphaproteobacteria bacterium]|nr:energy-dependent translational throttle protein EttA [Alphaproteobacteria bacterium]